jgi:hypothetical protein
MLEIPNGKIHVQMDVYHTTLNGQQIENNHHENYY